MDHTRDFYLKRARRIVAGVLGRKLGRFQPVHHFDGDESNNSNNNLVACNDFAYHKLLHIRKEALKACGHVNWRRCSHCQSYDDPSNLYISSDGNSCYHRQCKSEYDAELKRVKTVVKEMIRQKLQNEIKGEKK